MDRIREEAYEESMKSEGEEVLAIHMAELGLQFRREWQFFPGRKWRFDFVLGDFVNSQHWAPSGVAIEVEGGIWSSGRHTRGKGYEQDLLKYNTATALGWRVFRFSSAEAKNGKAKAFLQEWLGTNVVQKQVR